MKLFGTKFLLLLFLISWSGLLKAQAVSTSLGSVNQCPGDIILPINVNGYSGVGAFSMTILTDTTLLSYEGYENPDSSLMNGSLVVNENDGIIYISWYGLQSVSLSVGSKLLDLNFAAKPGSGPISWDLSSNGACEYVDISGQVLPSSWNNGSVAILSPPVVTKSPDDRFVFEDGSTNFQATGSGSGLSYIWQYSTDGGNTWTNLSNGGSYSGINNTTLYLNNIPLSLDGSLYRCMISGTCPPVQYSDSAMLRVSPLITTTISDVVHCPGSFMVPITVEDFIGVGAFSMALEINGANLNYQGYQNVNPNLPATNLTVNQAGNMIYLSWYSTTAVTLIDGQLLELEFSGQPGSASLNWDIQTNGNCEYTDVNGSVLFTEWVNGNITINSPPFLTQHPSPVSIFDGDQANFSIGASGAGLSYQWQVSTDGGSSWFNLANGSNYSSVNSTTLRVLNAPLSFYNNMYRCEVNGSCAPNTHSNAAGLTVLPLIAVTIQSVTSCPGSISVPIIVDDFTGVGAFSMALQYDTSFLDFEGLQNLHSSLSSGSSVVNASQGVVYFSWFDTNDVSLSSGAALGQFQFTASPGSGSVIWDLQTPGNCEFSNLSGQILYSNWINGNVNIQSYPAITSHPVNTSIYGGGSTSFSTNATGNGLTYHWQVSTDNGVSWSDLTNGSPYSGVTSSTLHINPANPSMDGYTYRCRVSGSCNPEVFSNPAMLSVTQSAITTTLTDFQNSCTGNLEIPVNVTNFNNVGGMSLTMVYDTAKLSFEGYDSLHTELQPGIFTLNRDQDRLYISWASTNTAYIGNGRLMALRFKSLEGISTQVSWDLQTPGNCEYVNSGGNLITSFFNNSSISVASDALMVNAGSDVLLNPGDSTSLYGSATGGSPVYNYDWKPASWITNQQSASPLVYPPSATNYVLSLTDGSGCIGKDAVIVDVISNLPVLNTDPVSSVTYFSAVSGGNVISDGGSAITSRGVCWNVTGTPTIFDNTTTDGTGLGAFISSMTSLQANTSYYVRAYATNSAGTAYGEQYSFTTDALPPNQAPTIDAIVDPLPIAEDAGQQQINLRGISDGNNEYEQNISIIARSSNPSVIPAVAVNYASDDSTGTLDYSPAYNAYGSSLITVIVRDDGGNADGGMDSTVVSFTVEVYAVNDAPFANAGDDQNVGSGSVVVLNGNGSFDIENDSLFFSWSAPSGILLSDTTAIQPSFISPILCNDTVYQFDLIVNDGDLSSATDHVSISVAAALPIMNAITLNIADTLITGDSVNLMLKISNQGVCDLILNLSSTAPWISFLQMSVSIAPGDTASIPISLNADNLTADNYNSFIHLSSNEPNQPSFNIPVSLTVLEKLRVDVMADPPAVCEDDSTQLMAIPTGGYGSYTYSWTSLPAGFASNAPNPQVQPLTSTQYILSISDGNSSTSDTVLVPVFDDIAPGAISGTLPTNNTFNLEYPIEFSWDPSANTFDYDLYIWPASQNKPSTPFAEGIQETYYSVSDGLDTTQYHFWQLHANNPCQQTQGPVELFSFSVFSDLVVDSISIPDTIDAGSSANISFTILNRGSGGTGSAGWKDDIYLSADQQLDQASDIKLGSLQNLTALSDSGSYTSSLNPVLDHYLSGTYYIFIVTDAQNTVSETDENNNTLRSAGSIHVVLPPYPDLKLRDVQPMSSHIIPDSVFSLGWIVENIGDDVLAGSWSQKVSLVNPTERRILGYVQSTDTIAVGGIMSQTATFSIPKTSGLGGNYFIEVELIPVSIVERPGGDTNNIASSTISISVQKKLFISIPVSSIDEDNAADVQCMIYRSGFTSSELIVDLSVNLPNYIAIPDTVVIPASQTGTLFNISALDNTLFEGNKLIGITATAPGYIAAEDSITIIEDEKIVLSLNLDTSSAEEGDTIAVQVSRGYAPPSALTITLNSSRSSQVQVPLSVTINANDSAAIFNAIVIDDASPEFIEDITISAFASGVVAAYDTISIIDDDVPQFSLSITPDTVSESGGPYAAWGKISLASPAITTSRINISSSPAGQLYYPSRITIPAGVMEKEFNIGVVDNGIVDSSRMVEVSATLWLSSCNCGLPADEGGVKIKEITVRDNDGPSLSVIASPFSVPEGVTNAGILRISRNTQGGSAIQVNIQNADTSEVMVASTATITSGQDFVDVPFSTVDDSTEDGNVVVPLNVSSSGYNSGSGWIMVSDQNLPDLTFSSVEVSADSILVYDSLQIEISLHNQGFAEAPAGADVKLYRSADNQFDSGDNLILNMQTDSILGIGDTTVLSNTIQVPPIVGTFYLIAVVNASQAINELISFNNEQSSGPISFRPDFSASVTVDSNVYNGNSPIIINGSLSNTKGPGLAERDVDVYIVVNGTRRVVETKSDSAGEFQVSFISVNGEAGDYHVGACFPGEGLNEKQDEFIITGMKYPGSAMYWDALLDDTVSGSFEVRNFSSIQLQNVQLQVVSAPPGFSINANPIASLNGLESSQLNYTISSTVLTEGGYYEEVKLRLVSSNGSNYEFRTWFYCQAPAGHIKAYPASISDRMVLGQSTIVEFDIENIGTGRTGRIDIQIPDVDWMSLVIPDTISNIPSGGLAKITLRLTPNDSLPLNVPITGTLVLSCEHANAITIPFNFEVISTATGDIKVIVEDEYTYLTPSAALVDSARVILRHPYSGALVAEGYTGSDGIYFKSSIPEGLYTLLVTANKHSSSQSTILIEKGEVNELTVFLGIEAISFSWEVVPTTIPDEYTVELIVDFESNVPVPIVTMDMPDTMPALATGQQYPFIITLTNTGFITANDFKLNFPDDPEYEFYSLADEFDIPAYQSIQVPVIFQLKTSKGNISVPQKDGGAGGSTGGSCSGVVTGNYNYQCGGRDLPLTTAEAVNYFGRSCNSVSINASQAIRAQGARAFTGGSVYIAPGGPGLFLAPHEVTHTVQQGCSINPGGGEKSQAKQNAVCATVTVKFEQNFTFEREAFDGTLVISNGNDTAAMTDIQMDFVVKDENGVISNDLFQINTLSVDNISGIDGTGVLNAQQEGSVVIRFIPEKGAAPTVPKSYSFGGSFSYFDPFANDIVTRELYPVTLQVNPSPDLYLTYFMQRDIFGDDALTEPIEPSIPAELAVMIENKGYGTARNAVLESAQPEIIENEKGLLIDFEIIGSNLGGKPVNLGLFNVNFGDIQGNDIAIGQWWFTSSLLGHFVSYSASVNHKDSWGNQDLSLIGGVEIHELIRSISAYGPLYDSINDFLVNDIPDASDEPDKLYYSNGTTADVTIADTAFVDGPVTAFDTVVILTMTRSSVGWNYTRIDDPGDGNYRILSVSRNEDGQIIPLDNIWLTYSTLPDGGTPIYENKLHFVDRVESLVTATYTIVFAPIDQDVPEVIAINRIPQNMIDYPLDTVDVEFSEPIVDSTFTYEDLTLKRQGGPNLIDDQISITKIDETTYSIDLSSKTSASGYYVLTVQTAEISDLSGNFGFTGKQASWIQSIDVPSIVQFSGIPQDVGETFDTILVLFSMPILDSTFSNSQLMLIRDNTDTLSVASLSIANEDGQGLQYRITGLQALMTVDGDYSLLVKVTDVTGNNGQQGLLDQWIDWKVCSAPYPVSYAGLNDSICENTAYTLSGNISNASSFTWQSSGSGSFSNNTTLTPTYHPGPSDQDSVRISLIAYSGDVCNNSDTSGITLYIGTLPSISGSISGPQMLAYGDSAVEFSILPVQGAEGYVWVLPDGIHVLQGGDSNVVSLMISDTAASGSIHVFAYNSCGNSGYSEALEITVAASDVIVWGEVFYGNSLNTPLSGVNLMLYRNDTLVDEQQTGLSGEYEFLGLLPGNYRIEGSYSAAWGGVNALDALVVLRHFVELISLQGIYLQAADIDNNSAVNATDALMAAQRFVEVIQSFPSGDWVFGIAEFIITTESVEIDINALCVGDVNGSFVPDQKSQAAVEIVREELTYRQTDGSIRYPVRIRGNYQIGSFSLALQPAMDISFDDISKKIEIRLTNGFLIYNSTAYEQRIAWYSLYPLQVQEGDTLMYIVADNRIPRDIRLSGESMFSDIYARELHGIQLSVPEFVEEAPDTWLGSSFPNPASGMISIPYSLSEEMYVELALYSISGQKIAVVKDGMQAAGQHELQFDSNNLAEGVYFCGMKTGKENPGTLMTIKVIIAR